MVKCLKSINKTAVDAGASGGGTGVHPSSFPTLEAASYTKPESANPEAPVCQKVHLSSLLYRFQKERKRGYISIGTV